MHQNREGGQQSTPGAGARTARADMPKKKRNRDEASASTEPPAAADTALLAGGHREKPGTIDKFRSGQHCDVVLQPSDGSDSRTAHRVVLMGSSEYFEALSGGWLQVPSTPL